ncbi:MAG: cytochrome c3 family protein [Nitrospinota bacterium]
MIFRKVCSVFSFIFLLTGVVAVSAQDPNPAAEKMSELGKNDPRNKNSRIYLDTAGNLAGTGDPNKSGKASKFFKDAEGWHPAALADADLPKDKFGYVNWVKLQTEGFIDPKWTLDPDMLPEDEMLIDVDVLFEAKGFFTNNVVYPHDIHTWWLKCEICHDTVGGPIFEPVAGGNNVLMVKMRGGQWCGRCHNKVAFPLTDCKRCHVRPKNAPVDETLLVRDLSQMTNMGY